jgi:hypothetical protein
MANEPGNTGGDKPGGDAPAGQPAQGPGSPPPSEPAPSRGPFLIVTPPGSIPRAADRSTVEAVLQAKQTPPPPLRNETGPAVSQSQPPEPVAGGPEPERLVDPPPQRPAEKPAPPRGPQPSLSARSADRLAAMNPPPPRKGGGCLILLLVFAIIAGGGYFLWRAGKLEPVIAIVQPYSDPIMEKIRPIIAKIEALIPGHEAGPAPAQTDEAMILETKQLLLKLDFQPGPMNGTLDPATVAAIEAYQEAAGLPIDGQPSPALLDDLRSVANPSAN